MTEKRIIMQIKRMRRQQRGVSTVQKAEVTTAVGIVLLNQTAEKKMETALEIKMPQE